MMVVSPVFSSVGLRHESLSSPVLRLCCTLSLVVGGFAHAVVAVGGLGPGRGHINS